MRARGVGLALVGLGGCALAVALLVRTWLAPAPVVLALDESFETVAAGEVTYLDPATLVPRTSGEVSLSVRVRGDAASGDAGDDTAVWVVEETVADADGTLVSTTTTVACLDRRSAVATDCPAESVDGSPADVRGLTVAFPPDTPRSDQDAWDGVVGEPTPARFAGAERFRGLEVYRFEQDVPEQVVGTVVVPGALVGRAAGTVPAEVVHSGTRTLLVEPVSGVVVRSEESPLTVLRGADGRPGAVLLDGTLGSTDATVDDAVARAREVLDRAGLLRGVVPGTLGATGAGLVALGVLLALRHRPAAAEQEEDEAARVPVPSA